MPHTYTLHALARVCKDCHRYARFMETVHLQHPCGTFVSMVNRNTFYKRLSPNRLFAVVHKPSCKRFVLKLLLRFLLLQETRKLDGQASQALTLALRDRGETWWADGDGNYLWRSLLLNILRSQHFYRQEGSPCWPMLRGTQRPS